MKPLIGVPGHGFSSHHCAATCEPELASADMCCEKVQNYMSPLRSFESIQIKYTYMELIYQIYLYVESIFGCNGVTGGSSEEYNFLRWSEYIQVKSEKLHFCPFHKTKTWNKVFCIWTILHSTQLATVWGSTQVSAAGAGLSATMAWRRCVCECGDADLGWQKQKINHSPLRRLIWFETKNILLWGDCFDLRHQLQDLLWGDGAWTNTSFANIDKSFSKITRQKIHITVEFICVSNHSPRFPTKNDSHHSWFQLC